MFRIKIVGPCNLMQTRRWTTRCTHLDTSSLSSRIDGPEEIQKNVVGPCRVAAPRLNNGRWQEGGFAVLQGLLGVLPQRAVVLVLDNRFAFS